MFKTSRDVGRKQQDQIFGHARDLGKNLVRMLLSSVTRFKHPDTQVMSFAASPRSLNSDGRLPVVAYLTASGPQIKSIEHPISHKISHVAESANSATEAFHA